MTSAKRSIIAIVLLVAVAETFRAGADGWWLARLAIFHQADRWCRYGCLSAPSVEGFANRGLTVHSWQGTIQSAQRLTTHGVGGSLVWQFWRGDDVVARWLVRAEDTDSLGWWYVNEELRLISTCVKLTKDTPFPLYVRERGILNLRYVVLVGADGRAVACLVVMWRT